jgi:CPA1 family monovalent cation:H+ antiporter
MHAFEYILILLVAVLASSFIGARFPKLPTPLVQIVTGVALTLLPLSFEVHLEPELFMVLFIAPLLFDDAKKMDKPSLWRLKYPVLLLALGLVICTVLVLGFVINLFAPSIPLAAAFALAAALAPTDAVAVSSLKQNARISSEQSRLLQGESLLNDASSIVSFNFAIAAAITGAFSVLEAGTSLLVMFVGGLALGVVVMLLRYALLRFLRARGIDSVSFHVLFEIITPVLIYLLAEFIGVSGIIAVVAAGIAHSFAPRVVTPSSARMGIVSTSVWSVISFTLNGLVFLMLGTQLPYVTERVWTGTAAGTGYLIIFVVLILFVIMALRFIWILVMQRNVNLGGGEVELAFDESAPVPLEPVEGEEMDRLAPGFGEMSAAEREATVEELVTVERQQSREARTQRRAVRRAARLGERQAARADKNYWKLHLFDALLLTLTGVKGAITLAIMLSVPMTLSNAVPFPERDLLLLLASGVILLSLLVANIVLPLIAPKKWQTAHPTAELNAILDIYRAVISSLDSGAAPNERAAAGAVIRQYYHRISTLKSNSCLELPSEAKVRRYAIELQLENTQCLLDDGKLSNFTALLYINTLSHQLARIEHHNTVRWELKAFWRQFAHRWTMRRTHKKQAGGTPHRRHVSMYEIRALQIENYHYAIDKLRKLEPTEDMPAHTTTAVRVELEQRVARLEGRWRRGHGISGAADAVGAVSAVGGAVGGAAADAVGTVHGDFKGGDDSRIALEARALDLERAAISDALDEGKISGETAKLMRDNVAIMELNIEDQLE